MKTLFTALLAMLFLPTVMAANPEPAHWATQILREEFPKYSNAVWTETKRTYEVKFNDREGTRCWMILNKKTGSTTALVRYYDESKLPSNVREFLQTDFPHTRITGVTEVNMDNRRVYQVNIEGRKRWHIVRIDDNLNMYIKDTFKKSS